MNDSEIFTVLMDNLRKEAGHYRRLRQFSLEQKDILVSGDLKRLPEVVRSSEREVFALGPLHAERARVLEGLGRRWGVAVPSLSDVSEKAPEEIRPSFREAVGEVVAAARELDDVNRGNEKLLQNAVDYVNFTLGALSDGGKPRTTYTPAANGTVPAAPAASLLNRVV